MQGSSLRLTFVDFPKARNYVKIILSREIGVKTWIVTNDCFLVISACLPNLAASPDWRGRGVLSNRAAPMPFVLTKAVLPTASP